MQRWAFYVDLTMVVSDEDIYWIFCEKAYISHVALTRACSLTTSLVDDKDSGGWKANLSITQVSWALTRGSGIQGLQHIVKRNVKYLPKKEF